MSVLFAPFAPFADGAPYGPTATKIMVLMTDGFNTHSPNYPDHEGTDVTTANQITAQTCANIKATGIVLYTIAFQVTDPAIKAAAAGVPLRSVEPIHLLATRFSP